MVSPAHFDPLKLSWSHSKSNNRTRLRWLSVNFSTRNGNAWSKNVFFKYWRVAEFNSILPCLLFELEKNIQLLPDLLLSLLLKYQDAPKRPWMIQHVFNVYFPQFQKPDVYGNIIMVMGCQIRSTMHEKWDTKLCARRLKEKSVHNAWILFLENHVSISALYLNGW